MSELDNIFSKNNTPIDTNKTNLDIDDFYKVLRALFLDLDLLDYSREFQDIGKFAFIKAFPDIDTDTPYSPLQNIVTYHVLNTEPFTSTSMEGNSTHYAPQFKKQQYNQETGNVEDTYHLAQEHQIELRCFSRSSETCVKLLKLIESILITHASVLKKYIKHYRHISTEGLEFLGEYDQKRLFTKATFYTCYTHIAYKTNLEQLKNITLTF